MVLNYYGENYFKIQSGSFTILIDPTNARSLKGANIVLNTKKPASFDYKSEENSSLVWIENQGEYEVAGIPIQGRSEDGRTEENTIYSFKMDEILVLLLGHLTNEPSSEILERIDEGIDILIIPGAGKPYLNEISAVKLVRQLEPSIIIPSLFEKEPKKFFAEFGENPKPEEKIVVKKKDLQKQAMKVVYLKP